MTRIYFDTEFTGLHKRTTLISIGLIDDAGRSFYAEFEDYDVLQVDNWIKANVIDKLTLKTTTSPSFAQSSNGSVIVKGDSRCISLRLSEWLSAYEDTIEFVSDVCHYDFMLLIDLLAGHALKLAGNIIPACHDVNQDIALYYGVTPLGAFHMNREMILEKGFDIKMESQEKHHALHDAKVIREIYRGLNDIEYYSN